MRPALLLLVLIVAACGKNEAQGEPTTKVSADDLAREQARFDAERQPEKLVEALGIKPGSWVADVGAGPGLITVHLARAVAPNGKVVATDIDGQLLEMLGKRLDSVGLGKLVERRKVAAEKPELEAGAYDAILLAEVDHYFADPVAWLKQATAALKPDGRIVISNRIYHRSGSMTAARKAGLVLISESTPVPTHYIAVFVAGDKK